MKKILWSVLAGGFALTAQAQVIYNNGPVVDGNGLSILLSSTVGSSTLGLGNQTTAGNAVADDFTIGAGNTWNVTSIDFYGYQTGATAFTFQQATWSIVSGDVNTGTVVASGVTNVTNGGQVGFRVTETTLTATDRRIFRASADVADFSLGAGTYFLRWSLTGSLASGPWQPPTSDSAAGNAFQSTTGGAFAPWSDAASFATATLPFTLNGTVTAVPEAGTLAMMLAGGLAVAGAARRRRQA